MGLLMAVQFPLSVLAAEQPSDVGETVVASQRFPWNKTVDIEYGVNRHGGQRELVAVYSVVNGCTNLISAEEVKGPERRRLAVDFREKDPDARIFVQSRVWTVWDSVSLHVDGPLMNGEIQLAEPVPAGGAWPGDNAFSLSFEGRARLSFEIHYDNEILDHGYGLRLDGEVAGTAESLWEEFRDIEMGGWTDYAPYGVWRYTVDVETEGHHEITFRMTDFSSNGGSTCVDNLLFDDGGATKGQVLAEYSCSLRLGASRDVLSSDRILLPYEADWLDAQTVSISDETGKVLLSDGISGSIPWMPGKSGTTTLFLAGRREGVPTGTWSTTLNVIDGPQVTISPTNGSTFHTSQEVLLASDEPDCSILYTLDGTDPRNHGLTYRQSFRVSDDVEIRAVAVRPDGFLGHVTSPVRLHRTRPRVAIVPADGTVFDDVQRVALSSDEDDVQIFYTLDGSDPDPGGILYEGPFFVDKTLVVRAIAIRPDGRRGDVSAPVKLFRGRVPTPRPAFLAFEGGTCELTLTNIALGASIACSVDGGEEWFPYGAPICLSETTRIMVRAQHDGLADAIPFDGVVTNLFCSSGVSNYIVSAQAVQVPFNARLLQIDYTVGGHCQAELAKAEVRVVSGGETNVASLVSGEPSACYGDHSVQVSLPNANPVDEILVVLVHRGMVMADAGPFSPADSSGKIFDLQSHVFNTCYDGIWIHGSGVVRTYVRDSTEGGSGYLWAPDAVCEDGMIAFADDGLHELTYYLNGYGYWAWVDFRMVLDSSDEGKVLSQYRLTRSHDGFTAERATSTTPVPVPHDWLSGRSNPGVGDYERLACTIGRNGCPLWLSYVAGLDPQDEASLFRATISFDLCGRPVVGLAPDPGNADLRRFYTVLGKAKLDDDVWVPVTDANLSEMRFFKVSFPLSQ